MLKEQTAAKRGLIRFCKRRLVGYKVPRLVEFREALSATAAGKVLKRVQLEA